MAAEVLRFTPPSATALYNICSSYDMPPLREGWRALQRATIGLGIPHYDGGKSATYSWPRMPGLVPHPNGGNTVPALVGVTGILSVARPLEPARYALDHLHLSSFDEAIPCSATQRWELQRGLAALTIAYHVVAEPLADEDVRPYDCVVSSPALALTEDEIAAEVAHDGLGAAQTYLWEETKRTLAVYRELAHIIGSIDA